MLGGRKQASSSFGPDGRRAQGGGTATRNAACHSSNKLFQPGATLLVKRAPVMNGLSIPPGLQRKFRRPMTKRRAYNCHADDALRRSSLGQKRRMDGMSKLMARAGRGLAFRLPQKADIGDGEGTSGDESDDDDEKENERPFEPLLLWTSPHQGGEPMGLPSQTVTMMQPDEYGVEVAVEVDKPAPPEAYSSQNVFVPPILAKWLRPHQREGVQFCYECVMGLKEFHGQGCILADDMGLGKTLQSVALIYTLLKTGITSNRQPTAKRVIVVCPCSLVKNWENEFVKWLGPNAVKTMALAESDRKTVEKSIDLFVRTKMFNILIVSYETIRTHVARLIRVADCCDLLVCDEAHRLKNSENLTSRALDSIPVRRRVLLTGTPMQNDLQEFYAMVNFVNQGVLGTQDEFRKKKLFPILRGREPDATESQKQKMTQIQRDMSATVNEFILRRINTLNAQHLPPKLVQVVCCNLTEMQQSMYQHLVDNKAMNHVLQGKQVNCLGSIQMLMKLCNHPRLIVEDDTKAKIGRRAASKHAKYTDGEETSATPGASDVAKYMPFEAGGRGNNAPVRPEWSGKMFVLYRLMKEMRRPGNGNDKIVIVSNYTQTLDLIGRMCRENTWGFCRLDGSINMKKRQKMVDEFNDPGSSLVAFLLSSKAGGCGLNLIGANRIVLFDPDWNPAVDKQAAARCWRDGQKKRCFTYRFLATGTVEEKIFQRQLSKEGLQSIVDDKEQVNALSTKDLRSLFKLRTGTPSDTHDKLQCERCKIIADHAEVEAAKVLPKKLEACRELLTRVEQQQDAALFLKPLIPIDHGVEPAEYEKLVKQPMDLATVRGKLELPADQPSAYKSISGVSKDVNRIFANVVKVWSPGQEIADAARRLQSWWDEEWHALVPVLMSMRPDVQETDTDKMESDDNLNERGEDYQEQIGMPDEENMRSWSHHYNTDTVDDPIFRAATRDCDSVSFVFGLEVTWSLIQQRQQEEEDRRAMDDIQQIQEIHDGENSCEDDGGGQSGDEDSNAIESDDSDEEEGDDEAAQPEEEKGVEYDQEEEPFVDEKDASMETQSSQEMESPEVSRKSSPAISTSTESTESVEDSQRSSESEGGSSSTQGSDTRSSQSSQSIAADSSANGEWACPTCTLSNKKSARKCAACNGKRPPRAKKRRTIVDSD